MADVVIIVGVICGFFALCVALVVGCDRIVRSGEDEQPVTAAEVTP